MTHLDLMSMLGTFGVNENLDWAHPEAVDPQMKGGYPDFFPSGECLSTAVLSIAFEMPSSRIGRAETVRSSPRRCGDCVYGSLSCQ